MRAQRQKVKMLQQGSADPDDVVIAKAKYQAQLQEYKSFCKDMDLTPQMERVYIDGLGRVAPGRAHPTIENTKKGSIIKNIDIDDMMTVAYGKEIDEKVIKTIYDSLKPNERAGAYFISEVSIKSISSKEGTILLQIEPIEAGRTAMLRLNINKDAFAGKTIDEINERIKNSANTVANSLEEAVIHECGHAKLISGYSVEEIENLYKELSDMGVEGISQIAFDDGVEAIAEIEVLLHRGENVSKAALDLYNKYTRRDK